MKTEHNVDVVVVGGGPGGSTIAALVARAGHRVMVLERERFPRHQLGESLLPATIHFICELLGVKAEVEAAGFTRKHGGYFLWGKSPRPWSFEFGATPALTGPNAYAYQVRRAEFDKILLDNARRLGVDVREEHSVRQVVKEDGRVVGVEFTDADGRPGLVRARYVVDASGNTSKLHGAVGERVYSKYFQNIALYGYYEGGKRLAEPHAGSIYCAAFAEGWFWYIPLSPTMTSVGAVVDRKYADMLRQAPEDAMQQFIAHCPSIADMLAPARRVTEGIYGQLRVRKDWSYCNTRFWGPGMILLGDAACFIDPVFSSGVHLATYGALLAARSINTCLAGQLDEARCFEEFELRYRREYGNFYQFLLSFYDMHQDEQSYFWKARDVLRSEEGANEAFVRLVSGVSTNREPVFCRSDQVFAAKSEIWSERDKFIEQWRAHKHEEDKQPMLQEMLVGFADKVSEVLFPPDARARTLNVFQSGPENSRQLFDGGLVPSDDELHWCAPA
ncbi:tryptophan 7-halogenase [Nannocystis sp. SCPEA4]|uniref:tryptophan 7-halogenase n=1 Tax=Nannocystis sp. SCPEA4 TaxID=2996787 RepID=UPI0022702230|nr:tryptophan 7-halogenase [Nannocystis sp. SCPEA4]MCY1054786.1 tryptophan 7-halogenase [Nannocystis sp. SCPEA4]